MYKILINDRNYASWEVLDVHNKMCKVDIDIQPFERKLFTNDEFHIKSNVIVVSHSSIRSGPAIPAVLILHGNKTYGRQHRLQTGQTYTPKRAQYAGGKLLYKCIPDDMRLPAFLVPYEIKDMSFSKAFVNLYVTIAFDHWDDKHPRAKLDNVLGPVDVLDHFYEYQLYCKSLHASIQRFQKDATKSLEHKSHETVIKTSCPNMQDRTDQYIITIDPLNSQDYDDGFGLVQLDEHVQRLSIYISNVTIWMDALHLWNSFSRRISTIYLPDKKRPMLPAVLSDYLCSLQKGVTRVALVLDLFIQNNEIIDTALSNALIKVSRNYVYEEAKLLGDPTYHRVLEVVSILSKTYTYINAVRNSRDLVSYLMILMNCECARQLLPHKAGIFRSTVIKQQEYEIPSSLPEDVAKFMKIWRGASGQYIAGDTIDTNHALLQVDAYIHITSPIRRLVDLLNMIKVQQVMCLHTMSPDATTFYDKWLCELEYINVTMRSIRKVQCDCSLLDLCHNIPDTMEREYDGYVFDKLPRNDGLYQYVVFLPELKMTSRIVLMDALDNFARKKFKLFLFKDEEHFKQKIRLQLI